MNAKQDIHTPDPFDAGRKGCRYGFSWCNPKLLWPLGFPGRFVMAFGYRLVSVGVSAGDTANMSKIVMSRSTEDTQIHNWKTDWFCTRNPYTEVLRVSVFGTSPIGYQCLVHDSPTWSPPESNLCIRNFCPVLIYIPWTQMGLHILQDLPHKMLLVNPPKKEVNWVLGMYSFFCYASMGWIFRGWSQNPTKASLWCAESSCLTL